MERLVLSPEQDGYSAQDAGGQLSAQLDGPMPRARSNFASNAAIVSCKWKCDQAAYAYLKAFYRNTLHTGSAFLIELLYDRSDVQDYRAQFEPDSWNLDEQEGELYSVSATLRAVPAIKPDATLDALIVEVMPYFAAPNAVFDLLDSLYQLTHVTLPEYLGDRFDQLYVLNRDLFDEFSELANETLSETLN